MTFTQPDNSGLDATHPHPRTGRSGGNMEGERRLASILFCDVQGSTAMAGELDPEEWAEIMDEAFDYLIAPVVRYGGTVARLMGDGILAVFGAPVTHENDAERAVLAGLSILEGIRPYKEKIQQIYHLDFDVRVGINTGMVVVGEIGSNLAAEWTAMGDAVNLAARMEQTAARGALQVSEDTYRLVKPLFDFEPLGQIEVKGKRGPVGAYRVLKAKMMPGRLRGIPGLQTPLIGRTQELEKLRQALAQLRQGRGGIACLIGDAGLGKSRLMEELRGEWMHELGSNGGWIEGRGISFEASRPYGLFRQYLLQTCNIEESDPPGVAREKILCAVIDPRRLQAGERNETLQAISLLLSPEESPVSTGSLEGEALKRELFREASEIFLQFAGQKPLVVVGDDLHWADPASIELLMHLFQLSEQIPILFLCALRPYRNIPGWQVKPAAEQNFPHRYTEVTLQALSDPESNALVDGLLAVAELPVELRRLVLRKAEGNPFFVEELIRNLIENQVVVHDADGLRWQAARQVDEISLPDSIHALLAGRIDRLDKEARHVLQLAAVIGRNFPYRVLQNISDPVVSLDSQLNILERAGLIWETARLPEREYTFRHELTAEAAYESILHRRRREYHRKVAQAFETLYPDQVENRAFLLAMHFDKALEREPALKYYTLAGDVAARLYANKEASHHYSRAIQIAREIGTAEQLITLYLHLGQALQNSGQNLEALARYRELEAEGETRQDLRMSLCALIPQATLHSIPSTVFDRAEGEKLSRRALELARRLEDHSAEARSLWNMMIMAVMGGGDLDEAINQGQRALAITRQYDLKEEQAYVLHDLARAYIYAGRADEGQVVLDEAKRLWRASGNQAMLADSLGNEGLGYALQGKFEKAIQAANEGLAVARAIDNPWGVAYNLMALGMVYYETGEVSKSIETFKEVQRFGEESDFIAAQVYSIILVSWIYGFYGDPGRGLNKIQELPGLHQNLAFPVRNLSKTGELYLHLLNEDLKQARQTLEDSGRYDYLMEVDLHYNPYGIAIPGEFALANGDVPKALAYAEKALALYEHRRQAMSLPDLYNLKGKVLLRMGQRVQALQVLEQAHRLARGTGARRSLWKVLLTLIEAYHQHGDFEGEQSARRQVSELAQFFLSQIQDEALHKKFIEKYGGVILAG